MSAGIARLQEFQMSLNNNEQTVWVSVWPLTTSSVKQPPSQQSNSMHRYISLHTMSPATTTPIAIVTSQVYPTASEAEPEGEDVWASSVVFAASQVAVPA